MNHLTKVNNAEFVRRRAKLAELMQAGIAIIPTASEKIRNRDSHFPFRFDSYFYYLTGFTEPEAVLVVIAGSTPQSILFCRGKDPEREIWDGYRFGPEAARTMFAFDDAFPIGELEQKIPGLLANQPSLSYAIGIDAKWDEKIWGWLNQVRAQGRAGVKAPDLIRDVRVWLDEMRLFKSANELVCMRRAAAISGGAHRRAMQYAADAQFEYEIEAALLHEFRAHGADAPAYSPIVASGANACVLHYVANNAALQKGDLLLIDAGCEVGGYAADITRTFPINGKFSAAQKSVYEIVLAAQAAAIAESKPGISWEVPHLAAVAVIAQGIKDLGLSQRSVTEIIEGELYKRFYMHRTGHWLGLDVHDAGDYKKQNAWRQLEPGMTLTVEPGLYVTPGPDVPKEFWNIGVRIEDDVLITDSGNEILTSTTPKSVAAIEALMGGGK